MIALTFTVIITSRQDPSFAPPYLSQSANESADLVEGNTISFAQFHWVEVVSDQCILHDCLHVQMDAQIAAQPCLIKRPDAAIEWNIRGAECFTIEFRDRRRSTTDQASEGYSTNVGDASTGGDEGLESAERIAPAHDKPRNSAGCTSTRNSIQNVLP